MTNKILMFCAVMFSSSTLASSGCGFGEEQDGLIGTCAEKKQEVILTGPLGFEELRQQPNYEENFEAYQPNAELVKALAKVTTPIELVVIVGTWCPDCHRETPRLAKVLAEANNPHISIKYIGVDRKKKDPENLSGSYQFKAIPTIMVFRNGEELGRVVERPEVSLEHDLFKLLDSNS